MALFLGTNAKKSSSEHIQNILNIIRGALIEEDKLLENFGYNFYDVYKELHFLAVMQSALRNREYATVLEDSDTKDKGSRKVRNDMLIWWGKKWENPIALELKMIWSTDRNDKIESFVKDIKKMERVDNKCPYICAALYLYNKEYEQKKRRVSTEDILLRVYSKCAKSLHIRHQIKNFHPDGFFDFPITPPLAKDYDYNISLADRWDRCRLIYCAKGS